MRPLISLILSCVLLQPAFAQQTQSPPAQQPDTSYHLLWYKGKKIRPNVLLTRAYDTVTFIPAKNKVKVVSKSGKGKIYDGMMAELSKTPQRMKETMQFFAAKFPKTMVPYMAEPIQAAYKRIQDDLTGALSNTIDLSPLKQEIGSLKNPDLPATNVTENNLQSGSAPQAQPAKLQKMPQNLSDYGNLEPGQIREVPEMKELLDYYEKYKNEEITWAPVPPTNDYAYCTLCDSAKEARWQRDYEIFRKEFVGRDEYMMQRIMGMARDAELYFPEPLQDEINNQLLEPVAAWIIERADKRARLLVEKYIDDPSRVRAVVSLILGIDRFQQLFGLNKGDDYFPAAFRRSIETISKMLLKAMKEYDYPLILNMNAILSADRQFQLVGGVPAVNMVELLNFNQFKLHVDVSAKASGDKGYQLAQVRGDNWYAAIPGKDCTLQWVLLGPDKSRLKVELLSAEIRGGGGEIPYVGTKDWQAPKPAMRIEFCGNGKDTVEAYAFNAEGFNEIWQYPAPAGATKAANMNAVLTGCFV
ncbi:MAG: hypothetical protein WCF67_09785, partial [Chitinophagaceae bacterium]